VALAARALCSSHDLRSARVRRGWRPHELWNHSC
jgi:hypothetical protein